MKDPRAAPATHRSEFAESLRRGVLVGAALLVLILPPALYYAPHHARHGVTAKAPNPAQSQPGHRYADFGTEAASTDARRVANWVADSRDNGTHWFVVLDKREAKVFLFDRDARLQTAAPALL